MTTHKDNFNLWFRDIIKPLYKNEHAGFPLLMLTFPLLERYLRSKSGINDEHLREPFRTPFFDELRKIFPSLQDNDIADKFWHVYRNGILHQATFLYEKKYKSKIIHMPEGWLSSNKGDVEIDISGNFWVNPIKFSERVIDVIDKDFSTFEAINSPNPPLPTVKTAPDGFDGTTGSGKIIKSIY